MCLAMLHTMMLAGLAMLPAAAGSDPLSLQAPSRFSIQSMLSDGQAHEAAAPSVEDLLSDDGQVQQQQSSLSGSTQATQFGGAVNPLQTLLNGAASLSGRQSLSVESMDVVSGLTEAFLHKVQLQPGEKSCLKNNVGQITGDLMATGQDLVTAIRTFMKWKTVDQQEKTTKLISAGFDSALKLASMVTMSTQLIRNCVHGDALEMLKRTGRHLINAQYLGHRFVVNGVDIAHGLADSVVAFEAKDFHRFGSDIGTSLRKVLLSNANRGTDALPEGVPEQDIVQKVTSGLMKGFFVKGSGIVITDTADPDVRIVMNLHHCIAGNSMFFKEIWNGVWHLFAQLSLNAQQHGLGLPPGVQSPQSQLGMQGQPKWAGELMISLLQVPMALQRCGLGAESQSMFMEAVQSLKHVHMQFVFPDDRIQVMKATDRMARAVEAWTSWDFETFGKEVGMLLRELVMLAFPKKYSVDSAGKLRHQLLDLSAQPPRGFLAGWQNTLSGRKHSPLFSAIVGGCALSILVALLALRSIRLSNQEFSNRGSLIFQMEDDDAVE